MYTWSDFVNPKLIECSRFKMNKWDKGSTLEFFYGLSTPSLKSQTQYETRNTFESIVSCEKRESNIKIEKKKK